VKRYLSDGLAKMALSLADDGSIAGRLGTPDPGTLKGRHDAQRF
jgi:hypothetical protein